MVHIAADLPQFLQRRELAAYEQRLARTAYAYGVDLRRAQWLAGSTIGDPLMRTVDRQWSGLVHALEEDSLLPQRKAPPTALLEEIAHLIYMLRAPLPTLRLLRRDAAAQWPTVTPLGTTKGSIHWLVLDLERVMALPPDERTFVLAAGLGHLQCDHGSIFAAHLLAHRKDRAAKLVRTVLRPWAKVAVFSADRAGLVAVQSLPAALRAVERQHAEHVAWLPRWPKLAARRAALEDFDQSSIMARRRVLAGEDGNGWAIAPPGREEDLDSLTHKVAATFDGAIKLGGRLALRIEGHERRARKDEPDETKAAPSPKPARTPEPPAPDSELASRLERALHDAWTLARCDQRLTRRLGLL